MIQPAEVSWLQDAAAHGSVALVSPDIDGLLGFTKDLLARPEFALAPSFSSNTTLAATFGQQKHDRTELTERLVEAELWELRNLLISSFGPERLAVASLVRASFETQLTMLIPYLFDHVGPNMMDRTWNWFHRGTLPVLVLTHQEAIVKRCQFAVVVSGDCVIWKGTVNELFQQVDGITIDVKTEQRARLEPILKPFAITVTETRQGLRFESTNPEADTAQLILKGLADVTWVHVKQPTLASVMEAVKVRGPQR